MLLLKAQRLKQRDGALRVPADDQRVKLVIFSEVVP
jgi:hypothetical protein